MTKRRRIDRRDFLSALVLIPVGAKLAGCGGDEDGGSGSSTDGGRCDGLESTSSRERNHEHAVCVPQVDLDELPEEGRIYETDGIAHRHTVTLSQAQLQAIADGETVMIFTSTELDHAHEFVLSLAGSS